MTQQFLKEYGIEEEDWKLKVGLESAPVSRFNWDNGLSIQSEPGRVVFQYDISLGKDSPNPYKKDCLLGEIAERYVSQLSKVKYNNVGINFVSFSDEFGDIQKNFPKLFLSSEILKIPNISQNQIQISRKIEQFKNLILTIAPERVTGPWKGDDKEISQFCLSFRGNLHCEITKNSIADSLEDLTDIIKSWDTFYIHYSTLVNEIINALKENR